VGIGRIPLRLYGQMSGWTRPGRRGRYSGPGTNFAGSRFVVTLWEHMVFVLDNYDSFTYNLVQYLG